MKAQEDFLQEVEFNCYLHLKKKKKRKKTPAHCMAQIQAKYKFCINSQKFELTATPAESLSGKAEDTILHVLCRPELVELC